MDHQQRVDLYKQYMAASGADVNAAVPYLWELAWSLGWKLPPPPFMSSLGLVFFAALVFPVLAFGLWLLLILLRPARHSYIPFTFATWVAVALGLYGVIVMPIYFRRMAKRYGLVHWSSFRGVRQRDW